MSLQDKNALVIIPNNQFCEEELFPVLEVLKAAELCVVVLSKTGAEAVGMNRKRFQPDGYIVDWDKQEGVFGKYHAVLFTGGRGASKSIWNDTIIPQILTDHYRAGRIVGALGAGMVALAKASLLMNDCAAAEDEKTREELENLGVSSVDQSLVVAERIVTAGGPGAARQFAETIVTLLSEE